MVPAYATSAALLYVACVMARGLAEIDWDDITEYAPAVVAAITMPLTYSIATGIGLGFITYALAKIIAGKVQGGHARGDGAGGAVRHQVRGDRLAKKEAPMPVMFGFKELAALPEERVTDKISRRVLSGKQGMMVWWTIKAGAHAAPHKHPHEQIVWMLKGRMDFRIGEERRSMVAGDVAVIPSGVEHEGLFRRGHRGGRHIRAAARGFSRRRHARLHAQELIIRR